MAAASPAMSNNSSDAGVSATVTASASVASLHRMDVPPKTLRGLNKPKCIQCGNVARSRCPYQSCKSCCAKAQNPCHIHVLKANATLADKVPATSTPALDPQPIEVSPAVTSLRVASLRQISNSFSLFNNLQGPRSKKPLTKKEAVAVNEWRFSKLKEERNRNIDVENEAFERYMKNVSLLEEVFSVKSVAGDTSKEGPTESCPDQNSAEDDTKKLISEQKLRLRSNPVRSENVRKRIQHIVDEGLKKLQKRECSSSSDGVGDHGGNDKGPDKAKGWWIERASAFNDLIDKLNKARNEEDLKSCSDVKAKLYTECTESSPTEAKDASTGQATKNNMEIIKELDYFSGKLFQQVEIDQEALKSIDAHFSTLEKIEDL